ncbi:hypothetical protein [Nocardia sp. CA-290969]|uniref:hypothetical protein n=1 Tax=Nocardia sp. CA-290969 TaxID=3239986 RepID=UPI003D8A34C4
MSEVAGARGELVEAIAAGAAHLVSRQEPDGYWRDFHMPPGRSDTWITGCVGVVLNLVRDLVPTELGTAGAIDRAACALRASRRKGGWGYSRRVPCDADSTSWAVRLLAGYDHREIPGEIFDKYVTSASGIRTFRSPKFFGSWADEHDEVTPAVGLAFLALGDSSAVDRIRPRVVERHRESGGWTAFWWRSDAYGIAHNLMFLARTGGVPADVAAVERARLDDFVARDGSCADTPPEPPFDTAHRLIAAIRLDAQDHADLFLRALLEAQLPDGSWPPSARMLVPGESDALEYIDDRGLLSTAVAVMAAVEAVSTSAAAREQYAAQRLRRRLIEEK